MANEPRQGLWQWGEFQGHTSHLAPFIGTIGSDMISQGQQKAVRESRPASLVWQRHCAWVVNEYGY